MEKRFILVITSCLVLLSLSLVSANIFEDTSNRCQDFGFDYGVGKMYCDAWVFIYGNFTGIDVLGDCRSINFTSGNSNASGVIIDISNGTSLMLNQTQGQYSIPQECSDVMHYITFCGMNPINIPCGGPYQIECNNTENNSTNNTNTNNTGTNNTNTNNTGTNNTNTNNTGTNNTNTNNTNTNNTGTNNTNTNNTNTNNTGGNTTNINNPRKGGHGSTKDKDTLLTYPEYCSITSNCLEYLESTPVYIELGTNFSSNSSYQYSEQKKSGISDRAILLSFLLLLMLLLFVILLIMLMRRF